MMIWWHWMVLGLVLLGVEILTLGGLGEFLFLVLWRLGFNRRRDRLVRIERT